MRHVKSDKERVGAAAPISGNSRSTLHRQETHVTVRNFHLNPQGLTIAVRPSIGRDNYDAMVVVALAGELTGWRYIVIAHVEEDGCGRHLRAHPHARGASTRLAPLTF